MRYRLLIFIRQLESIIAGNINLHSFQLREKKVDDDTIHLKVETNINEKLIRNKAFGLAKLRFPDRQISQVEFKDNEIHIKFKPRPKKWQN